MQKLAQPAETEKQLTLELEPVTEPLVAEEPVSFLRTMKQLSGKTCLRRSRSYFQSFKMAYLSLYGRNTGELATLESQRWVATQQFSDYVFPKPQQKWWNCSKEHKINNKKRLLNKQAPLFVSSRLYPI